MKDCKTNLEILIYYWINKRPPQLSNFGIAADKSGGWSGSILF
jgi:hypothetical protein